MENRTQKIAFLISAYTEPESLHALVRKLDEMLDADFFIHIDKKVAIEPFKTDLETMPNVFFIQNRVRVYWGGYSQVEMQLSLIKEMLCRDISYLRVVNLTGTDYPVVSNEELYERLSNTEIEYIAGFDVRNGNEEDRNRMAAKYSKFHYMDSNRIIHGVINRLKIPRVAYKKCTIPIYFGSEYWALSFSCVKELYDAYLINGQLQNLFRYSFAPSEAWMHTMFFNSAWRKKAIWHSENDSDLINLSPITYFKYGYSVKILDENDYNDIITSERMFARKIIVGKSDQLVALLPVPAEIGCGE